MAQFVFQQLPDDIIDVHNNNVAGTAKNAFKPIAVSDDLTLRGVPILFSSEGKGSRSRS